LEERQSERSNTREKLATIWHRRRSRGSWHRPSFRTGGKGKGACKACRKEAWDRGDRPKGRRKGQKRKKNGPTLGDVQSVQSTSTNRLLALYEAQERAAMHWERAAIQIDIDRELARRRTA
jgi:hypothetical protein